MINIVKQMKTTVFQKMHLHDSLFGIHVDMRRNRSRSSKKKKEEAQEKENQEEEEKRNIDPVKA